MFTGLQKYVLNCLCRNSFSGQFLRPRFQTSASVLKNYFRQKSLVDIFQSSKHVEIHEPFIFNKIKIKYIGNGGFWMKMTALIHPEQK